MLAKTVNNESRVYLRGMEEMSAKWAQLIEAGVPFIDHPSSLFTMTTKIKYIDRSECFIWQGLDDIARPYLPGEIARIELEREFGKPKLGSRWQDEELLDVPPPAYYDGVQREGRFFYVDVNSAYHQIYSRLSLDCVWPRGEGELLLGGVAQRLSSNKLARNALVGISRANTLTVSKGNSSKDVKFKNCFYNPALWRTIQSCLHELAEHARELGCFYIATDGYIFDNAFKFGYFTALLDDYGITYKTEKGEGYVTGWASYKVGRKQTKIKRSDTGWLDNLMMGEATLNWWKRRSNTRLSR